MTPERFREIVEAYGAVPQRWPAKERAAAEALILNSPEARKLIAREAGLDRLLDAYRIVPPDSALTGAIIASVPSSQSLSWASLLRGLGIVGAGIAGAVVGALLMTIHAPSVPAVIGDDDRPILTSFDVSVGDFDLGETQ